ncbi:MAG: spermidine synthase, partial [bacterium]
RLNVFRQHSSAVWGYCFDLIGSLLGVIAIAVLGYVRSFPAVWLAAGLLPGLYLFRRRRRSVVLFLAVATATIALVHFRERGEAYSPYYELRTRSTGKNLVEVLANGSLHQVALNLRRGEAVRNPYVERAREGYHLLYGYLDATPRRALVLGAGTGNDVAVLLDRGVQEIDAVEIDPVIVELGERLHPNRPYSDERVRVFRTDARSFLNEHGESYDLIVFGTLDSMTRLSALSNVRLDNYVYTREALEAAKRRLAPGGGVAMFFMVGTPYIEARLHGLLTEVFGEAPIMHAEAYGLFNRLYLAGPAFAGRDSAGREAVAAALRQQGGEVDLPSDDWPFLYLRERGISSFYASLIAVFLGIACVAILSASKELRAGLRERRAAVDLPMFLFGVAFLLLETRAVTAMNLVWGATWISSAIVFASILLMILLATIASKLRRIPSDAAFVGLFASIVMTYVVPVRWLPGMGTGVKLVASCILVGLPIAFAAICFAVLFDRRPRADAALGWNLLGAVCGGMLEFLSMVVGLKGMLLVALGAYLAAFASSRREGVSARGEG